MTEDPTPDSDHSTESESDELVDDMEDDCNSDTNSPTKIRLKAYDLEVEAESEDASFQEMAEVLTEEFEQIRRDAMVAEYEELEQRELHGIFLGDDR